jgi:SecY
MFALVAGAMVVNQFADYVTELKLGNGTSVLIFANIASYLPSSIGQAFTQAGDSGSSGIAVYLIAFLITTFGIVCVQARRRRAGWMCCSSRQSLHGWNTCDCDAILCVQSVQLPALAVQRHLFQWDQAEFA